MFMSPVINDSVVKIPISCIAGNLSLWDRSEFSPHILQAVTRFKVVYFPIK